MQGGELSLEFGNGAQIRRRKQCDRQDRSHHQSQELGGADLLQPAGGQPQNRHGDQGQGQLEGPDPREQLRQLSQRADHSPLGADLPQEGCQLKDHENDADPGHEAGDHRVRHLGDVPPQAEHPEEDLEQAGQDHHREGHRQGGLLIGSCGRKAEDHRGEHHRHRTGGFGNQGGRPTEQGGDQSNDHCGPESSRGTGT